MDHDIKIALAAACRTFADHFTVTESQVPAGFEVDPDAYDNLYSPPTVEELELDLATQLDGIARTRYSIPDDMIVPDGYLDKVKAAEKLVCAYENSLDRDLPENLREHVRDMVLFLIDMDQYRQWIDRSMGTDANSLVQMAEHMPGQSFEDQAQVLAELDTELGEG